MFIDLDRLFYRVRYWGISVSLPKSKFGKRPISYLSPEIGAEGIRAKPKLAEGVKKLPFPTTLKGIQSFLGSLNYYNKFIKDLLEVAAVKYELTDEQIRMGKNMEPAKEAFEILKQKIVSTPLLRHPDRKKPFIIILHANPWAMRTVLAKNTMERYIRFDSLAGYCTIKKCNITRQRRKQWNFSEFSEYSILQRHLEGVYALIGSGMSLEGRCEQWAARLALWPLEVHNIQNDEDGLASILGAGFTLRDKLDQIAENPILTKGQVVRAPPISLKMLESDDEGWLLSFDGSARTSDRLGSSGCIL
ncbi:reverse transcriptase [Phytophthora megakarya]|uniref:Reverse transcriptase n=1 Tax=Phytophthora megakarya TaxID=4795 RepID=A0A225WEG2_9STRA|nr:reverse transcriptase [Phytophthora megakarya]